MNDLRPTFCIRPQAVQAITGPHRGQAAKHLMSGKPEPALNPFGFGSREQRRKIVSPLGMPGVEHLAFDCFLQ